MQDHLAAYTWWVDAPVLIIILSVFLCGCHTSSKLKPFSSDGCSLFPDRAELLQKDWFACCLEHDIAYWRGGTQGERLAADRAFKACILEKTGDRTLAELMYEGVRLGGSPYFPSWYRWGYGWNFRRGYKPLSPKEREMVRQRMEAYEQEHHDAAHNIPDSTK